MGNKWPLIKLGELLSRSQETIALQPDTEYREITVKLWGKGVLLRGVVTGAGIAAERRYVARCGQFILSRIDARNGALGVVPPELDGAVVTNDFPLFNVNSEKLLVEYLGWMCRTASFVDECFKASEGTTNRVRLQENKFLSREIPIPPISEQRRLIARIADLMSHIKQACDFREQVVRNVEALFAAKLRANIISSGNQVKYLPFTELARLERRPVFVDLDNKYKEIGIYCFGKGIFHKTPRTGAEVGDKDLYQIKAGDFILQITFAWEGAVALAEADDEGLFGSVRYLTFRVNEKLCSPLYLVTYMRTPEAIDQLARISPGSAGRNRVLSMKRLNEVLVPVVPLRAQEWLTADLKKLQESMKSLQTETLVELKALVPSILNRAFKGEM